MLAIVGAVCSGYFAARAEPPAPDVVTMSTESLEALGGVRGPRQSVLALPTTGQTPPGQSATPQVPCTQAAPDPSSTCVNGFWQPPAAASTAGGAARIDRANGCLTMQPMSDMICRNGLWTLRGADTTGTTQPVSSLNSPPPAPDPDAASTLDPTRPPASATLSTPPSMMLSPSGAASTAIAACLSTLPPVLPTQSLACVNALGSFAERPCVLGKEQACPSFTRRLIRAGC